MTATMRVSSPGELAEIVPYMMGFTPEESLVILLTDNGCIRMTTRVDLTDLTLPGRAKSLISMLADRFPDDMAHFIAFTGDHDLGWRSIALCMAHHPTLDRTQAVELVVDGNTWCLPSGDTGELNPFGRVAAEATAHGLNRGETRGALAASFATAALTDELVKLIEVELQSMPSSLDDTTAADLLAKLLSANLGSDIDQTTAVRMTLLLANQDAIATAVHGITSENAHGQLHLWQQVLTQVPNAIAGTPMVLAGLAAWVSGNGAAANIALDNAVALVDDDRHRPLEHLLETLIRTATPPEAWESIRSTFEW